MAEEQKDQKEDELAEGADEKKSKGKSGLLKIILIAVGATLFLGVNAGITFVLVGASKPHVEVPQEEMDPAKKEEEDKKKKEADMVGKGPIYYKFDPAFVVNFQAQDQVRFLQVTVEVMSREEKVIAAVEQHTPVIRNNLILLFSSQDFTTISTRVGKERIRAQVLAEIQKVMKENIGRPGVEAVYFSSFVMQ